MNPFPLEHYALALVSLIAHWAIGRRLLRAPFFTALLVGVSFSGLVVGILCNRAASYARPYLYLAIGAGILLALRDLVERRAKLEALFRRGWPLLVFALLLFAMNEPRRTHFESTPDGEALIYNGHFPYIASQSIEVLNADYPGRLRLLDFYPFQWSRYHFFHASTQAVVQGLIPRPGLFSYFIAQTLLCVAMILAFLEVLFYRVRSIPKACALLVTVSTVGFCLFRNSVTFSLFGSTAWSLFAIAQVVLSLFFRQRLRALFFTAVFGASAFRCMPVAVVAALAIAIRYDLLKRAPLLLWRSAKARVLDFSFVVLFVVYNVVTYFHPGPEKGFFSRPVFLDDWNYPLSVYKFIGYFSKPLTHLVGTDRFGAINWDATFDRVPWGSAGSVAFVIFSLGLFLMGLRWVVKEFGGRATALGAAGFVALLGISLAGSKNLFSLHLMCAPYLILTFLLGRLLEKEVPAAIKAGVARAIQVVLCIQFATLLYQYTGADEIPTPVAYVCFDVVLWALIGMVFWTRLRAGQFFKPGLVAVFLLPIFIVPAWAGFCATARIDRTRQAIGMQELLKPGFRRELWVNADGEGIFPLENPVRADLLSSILGARINLSDANSQDIVNARFVAQKIR